MSGAGRKPSFGAASTSPAPFTPTGDHGAFAPEPPAELTTGAARIWARLLPDLVATGVFRASDEFLLVELCQMLAEARTCQAALRAEDDPGSPEAKRLRVGYYQAMKLALTLAGEFGITPVARLRLGLANGPEVTLLGLLGADEQHGTSMR